MKNKKSFCHLWLKRFCCFMLMLALSISNVTIAQATEASTSVTEAELITKTNPILKSYNVSDSGKLWTVTGETRFVVEATEENIANERLAEVVKLMNSEFTEKQIASSTPHAMLYAAEGLSTDILIRLVPVSDISSDTDSEEAYKITISDAGVVVEGACENAILYALRTIQELMITNNGLVYGTIVDYPDVAERRLHVDCARKYISKDWFIRQIREMSYLKMNALQIHFSENLGFRIECETDPAIVSDEYLTKAEVREILAEAQKYGIRVIPSFDSPGHVDQILRVHPEYGQVSSSGSHYTSGLDITNPEAVAYIYSLYDEYMELFEGCTDFHIGGDEYMEFDRAPFTTQYKSVLDAYAAEALGSGYIWKDALSNYVNELAEHVHSKGFKPRIWNDGIYYGENSYEGAQKIRMHDYIGIDFWSQMSWNSSIANLQTFINKGHTDIYNINASYFYYVLRTSAPTDGREQHSFDVLNQDANIYNNWTPGKFQGNTISDDSEVIRGAAIGIWCDSPDICTEDVIAEDIESALRALACKSWNVLANSKLDYDNFVELTDELGNVAGYQKGSTLPEAGEFVEGDDLGKIVIKYVDKEGNSLRDDRIVFGLIDEAYTITPDTLYGYRFVSMDKEAEGTFTDTEITITLTYELYTDKEALSAAVADAKTEADYIPATYSDYKAALADAKAALEDEDATQAEVDAALEALTEASEGLISLDRLELYLEVEYPIDSAGYTTASYSDYRTALTSGETVLLNPEATDEEVAAALNSILEKKEALSLVPEDDLITITSTHPGYAIGGSWPLSNMMDNDLTTFAWLNDAQAVGDVVTFTFARPVTLNSFRYQAPANAGSDIFHDAVVEISTDGENWTGIGTLQDETDKSIDAGGQTARYVRIRVVGAAEYWTKIAEITLDYTEEDASVDKSALEAAIAEAGKLTASEYSEASWRVLEAALANAENVLADEDAATGEVNAAVAALNASIENLQAPSTEPDPVTPVTDIFTDVTKGSWYEDAVQYVYDKGLMEGNGDKFTPNGQMTRGMFVTTLYRLAGEPEVTDRRACTELHDVGANAWYTDAVCWAYANEITTGYLNDMTFRTNVALSREQLATFVYRYAQYQGLETDVSSDLEGLLNADKVKEYAIDGVKWAVGAGIISGMQINDAAGETAYDLAPQKTATRAQMAQILMNFCEAYDL